MVSQTTGIIIGSIVILVIAGIFFGFIPLNFGEQLGGMIQIPTESIPVTGLAFQGILTIDLQHTNTLDPTFRSPADYTEGSEIITQFYKSFDGQTFSSVASGSDVLSGTTITVEPSLNGVLYMSLSSDGENFINPEGTMNVNEHITDFFFRDISNDGIKNWVFRIDLRDIPEPIAFQTASTIPIITQIWDEEESPTLNAPVDILGIGAGNGIVNFVRWELTIREDAGICNCGATNAQYEYTLLFDANESELWDNGLSYLDIPNIGIVPLSDFDEIIQTTQILYRFQVGESASVDQANYVLTANNGNDVHPIPAKIVTNFDGGSNSFNLQLMVKFVRPLGSTDTIEDEILLDRDV